MTHDEGVVSLAPGLWTFSHDRVRKVLKRCQPERGRFYVHDYHSFQNNPDGHLRQPHLARKFCLKLYTSVQDSKNHLSELDFNFDSMNTRPFMQTAWSEDTVSPMLLL